ncbi:hypothetical protein [Serratia quinivorans]|uniref:hypothetical protein n=1 Tax=Serratia quinivorans TaxID=137545 RepID=UPI0021BD3293|nr:hypothetical protein [Serratia quinivorans]
MAKLERNSMNKNMRILLLATALSGAASGMAFADDTNGLSGTMKFDAMLTGGSCVLSGNNINHDFGTLSKAQPTVTTTSSGNFKAYKVYTDTISVTDCPPEITEVSMTPHFYTTGNAANIVRNTSGSATKTNALMLIGGADGITNLYSTDVEQKFPISGETAGTDIKLVSQIAQDMKLQATPGDGEYNVTLTFNYD